MKTGWGELGYETQKKLTIFLLIVVNLSDLRINYVIISPR